MPLSQKETVDLLEHIASALNDGSIEHRENCGQCTHKLIQAEEASRELERDLPDYDRFAERVRNRWHQTKYYKFTLELRGGDPDKTLDMDLVEAEFKKKGWEM